MSEQSPAIWPQWIESSRCATWLGCATGTSICSVDVYETRTAIESVTKHRGQWEDVPCRPYPQNAELSGGR